MGRIYDYYRCNFCNDITRDDQWNIDEYRDDYNYSCPSCSQSYGGKRIKSPQPSTMRCPRCYNEIQLFYVWDKDANRLTLENRNLICSRCQNSIQQIDESKGDSDV